MTHGGIMIRNESLIDGPRIIMSCEHRWIMLKNINHERKQDRVL